MGCSRPLLVFKGDRGEMRCLSWWRACCVLETFKGLCGDCVGGELCKEGGELVLLSSRGSVARLVIRTLQ